MPIGSGSLADLARLRPFTRHRLSSWDRSGGNADFIRLVATEDEAMLESLQTGVNSRGFAPGPTVNLERAIHHLLNYYLDILLAEDEDAREKRINDGATALAESAAKNPEPRDGGYSKAFG